MPASTAVPMGADTKAFVRDLLQRRGQASTVILLDRESFEPPREYQVRPMPVLYAAAAAAALGAVLLSSLFLFTPLRRIALGVDIDRMRATAAEHGRRAAALEDSLTLQYQQLDRLRQIITGEVDTAMVVVPVAELPDPDTFELPSGGPLAEPAPGSEDWGDHRQPALAMRWLTPEGDAPSPARRAAASAYLSSLRLPVLPPVEGLFTRGFEARSGHYGIDLSVEEGTPVRSVGDGYVIFADWTYDGGYVVAVQHADGYLSAYKHNARLLKRVGDRVRSREPVALSGNTGEVTSGPHVHFEVWRDGLAQDPRAFLVGAPVAAGLSAGDASSGA